MKENYMDKVMTKYQYFGHLCKLADAHFVLNRNSKKRWLDAWTDEDLNWSIEKGFVQTSNPMVHLGEKANGEYYELTKKGKLIADWYLNQFWYYIKNKLFNIF
jgi:hypothetical protein